MDLDEFKASVRKLLKEFEGTPGFDWRRPVLEPRFGPLGKLFGWNSTLVGTFEASRHFIRLKENWRLSGGTFNRQFFSYHYGPYEEGWPLEKVECKSVVVRIDADNKGGRGYHLHDGGKDNRIQPRPVG